MKKILLLLLVTAGTGAYAQKNLLRFNLKKDSTYHLIVDAELNIDETIAGAHQTMRTTIKGSTVHKVIEVKDTVYKMEVSYQNIEMMVSMGQNTIDMNSDGDTTNMFNQVFHHIINKPFTVVMSNRGLVMEVKGFDAIFNAAAGKMNAPEAQKEQMKAQMQRSFGESSLKSNFQQSFIIYPKNAIAVKGIWADQTYIDAAAISAKIQNNYTLDNVTADAYEVSGNANVLPDKAPEYKQNGQFYMRMSNITGNNQYTFVIDKKTGWVTKSKTMKHFAGNAEVKQTLTGPVIATLPTVVDGDVNSTDK